MKFDFIKNELTENNACVFTAYLPSMYHHLEYLWNILSYDEKNQAEKFINVTLKNRYIISHGLLRHLLSFCTIIKPQDIQYSTNQFGKPFLKNDKYRVQFNISHSKDYAVYIIALDYKIGIDIEWKDNTLNFQELIEFLLSPTEIIIFNKLDPETQFHMFYDIWTKKEAIIKAIGQGLSYPLKTIEIMSCVNKNNKFYHLANETIYYYSNLCNLDNYAGAISHTHKFDKLIRIDVSSNDIRTRG